MGQKRDFFFAGEPVGTFLSRSYPMHPGRYLCDPYRGEGHCEFVQALLIGDAECSFSHRGQDFRLVISAEEFVEGERECQCASVPVVRAGSFSSGIKGSGAVRYIKPATYKTRGLAVPFQADMIGNSYVTSA